MLNVWNQDHLATQKGLPNNYSEELKPYVEEPPDRLEVGISGIGIKIGRRFEPVLRQEGREDLYALYNKRGSAESWPEPASAYMSWQKHKGVTPMPKD